jgi:hypothetical protein
LQDIHLRLSQVDGAEEDVEAAWLAEVERRLLATEHGTAEFEAWESVKERIAIRLREMRR